MLLAPAVCSVANRRRVSIGFTLLELLAVIALIAILSGLAFGMVHSARQQAALNRARAELAVLAQVLEEYRLQYGDYPQTADSPAKLYQALTGRLGPTGGPVSGRSLVATLPIPLNDADHPDSATNYFVDPWGHAYRYVYFTRQTGLAPAPLARGHVLFSLGARIAAETLPTDAQVVPVTSGDQGGAISPSPLNAKTIYADQ